MSGFDPQRYDQTVFKTITVDGRQYNARVLDFDTALIKCRQLSAGADPQLSALEDLKTAVDNILELFHR